MPIDNRHRVGCQFRIVELFNIIELIPAQKFDFSQFAEGILFHSAELSLFIVESIFQKWLQSDYL